MKENMSDNQVIYLCEDSPDGVFTAIYDAWAAHIPQERLRLRIEGMDTLELFTDYVYVQTDYDKAVKVARSIARKIGTEAYDMVYRTALSHEEDKVDAIYQFLKLGFAHGSAVMDMHGLPQVCRLFELQRNVWHEAHKFMGFVRFHESEQGILICRIKPKNQILPVLAEHFADRFPGEHFVIIDDVHEMAVFHQKNKVWFVSSLTQEGIADIWSTIQKDEYENLWRTFVRTIAIRERENYICQRTLCALRYRDYMLEFDS